MATGTINTFPVSEIEWSGDQIIAEISMISFAAGKTLSKRFDEKNLAGIERAVAAFAKELEADPGCYRLIVRMDKGVRAPAGFNAASEARNGPLRLLINPEKAKRKERAAA